MVAIRTQPFPNENGGAALDDHVVTLVSNEYFERQKVRDGRDAGSLRYYSSGALYRHRSFPRIGSDSNVYAAGGDGGGHGLDRADS